MIIVYRYTENGISYVDYGVDSETLENIVLPNELWNNFRDDCKLVPGLGWCLK